MIPLRIRGAALLLVLWLVFLLAGLLAAFAQTARIEGLQARYLARSTAAHYAAESGVEVAVMHLFTADPAGAWVPDGRMQSFVQDGTRVEVRIVDETGKVDLNVAAPDLLAGLMVARGVDEARATALAGAIADWRDPDDLVNLAGGAEDPDYAAAGLPYGAKDRPFDSVGELRQVLGMDERTYEAVAPYLTIYTGTATPTADFAPEPVLRAMRLDPDQVARLLARRATWLPGQPPPGSDGGALAPRGTGTYSIDSQAIRADGTRSRVQAVVRLGGGGIPGALYTPLAWRAGESD